MFSKYDVFSYFLSILINFFFLLIFFSTFNFKLSKEKEVKVKLISQMNLLSPSISVKSSLEAGNFNEEKPVREKVVPFKKSEISKSKVSEVSEDVLLKEKLFKIKSRATSKDSENDYNLSQEELKELESRMLAFQKSKNSGASSGEARGGESLGLEYLLLIKRKLQNNFEVPIYLRSQKDLYAIVNIELSSDGKILQYQFLKKSEREEFNKAVERCLKISSPLPVNRNVKIIIEFKAEGVGKIK